MKNPKFKKNIEEIILKIQQKPKLEPASTKGLDLLMETRRKELEDKMKIEKEIKEEDEKRKIKQNKLNDRVKNSKALIDNKKALEERKNKYRSDFKKNMIESKDHYENEMTLRIQKVYNRPLLFEQAYGTASKIKEAKKNKELVEQTNMELNN